MSETRTRIKICGITRLEDALVAIHSGADALGFIFVPNTPRCIHDFSDALAIPSQLPPFVSCVAVCADSEEANNIPSHFDTVQFYAGSANRSARPTTRLVQAFRMRDEESLEEIAAALERGRPHALLLDAYHQDRLGGSGKTFRWELAQEAKARFKLPIILAGGLTPENVGDAIIAVRPYAVDVASGVEAEPGRKDHQKLHAFCRAVRHANAAT